MFVLPIDPSDLLHIFLVVKLDVCLGWLIAIRMRVIFDTLSCNCDDLCVGIDEETIFQVIEECCRYLESVQKQSDCSETVHC